MIFLQPSRSFGGIDVKLAGGKDVVITSPDVVKVFTHLSTCKKKKSEYRPFMVAADGVWDVLDDNQVCSTVKERINSSL